MKVFIDWEFDIDTDLETARFLGLNEDDIGRILNDPKRRKKYTEDISILFEVPQVIDLNDFFPNPIELKPEDITNKLSNHYGWLINGWRYITKEEEDLIKDWHYIKGKEIE